MGINIQVYDVNRQDAYGTPLEVDWWDSTRYVGDSLFWYTPLIEWEHFHGVTVDAPEKLPEEPFRGNPMDGYESLRRPKNLEAAREWVESNLDRFQRTRFNRLIDEMMANDGIWLDA